MLARGLFAVGFTTLMLLGLVSSVLASPSTPPVWEPPVPLEFWILVMLAVTISCLAVVISRVKKVAK